MRSEAGRRDGEGEGENRSEKEKDRAERVTKINDRNKEQRNERY